MLLILNQNQVFILCSLFFALELLIPYFPPLKIATFHELCRITCNPSGRITEFSAFIIFDSVNKFLFQSI